MAQRDIIAVVGATGAQGGGLVEAILSDPEERFSVRALSRREASDKARALAARGATVTRADADDPASLERAFAGARGVFCVTNFWEHRSPERERAQARAMAEAARAAGVSHVVWSTLEDTRRWVPLSDDRMPTLLGKYKVPHFDAKGEADALFEAAGVPLTRVLTSFYWDNLIHSGMIPKPGPDGIAHLTLPMGERKLPGIAAEDIGRAVLGIFKGGARWTGQTVGIAGEHLTGAEMAETLSRALGREVRYAAVPFPVYRALGFPGAEDLANMFQFKHDFEEAYCRARSVEETRTLWPGVQSFKAWISRNRARLLPA